MFDKSAIPSDDLMYGEVDDINRSIAHVRALLHPEVKIGSLDDLPMLEAQVDIFFQAHFRRALAMLEAGKHAWEGKHTLLALIAVRCLYESAACIHDFCNQVIKLMDADNIPDAVRLAHQRGFSRRITIEAAGNDTLYDYTAVNILKQVDAMDKTVTGARRSYDQLSEVVHPNAYGTLFHFLQSADDKRVRFDTPVEDHASAFTVLLAGASLFTQMVDDHMRYTSKWASFLADSLQAKIDDYEVRKKRAAERGG